MLVALTARKLKSGAYDQFMEAWRGDRGDEPPSGKWTRAYTVRNVDDPDEVISFGLFDGTLEELRQSQQEMGYSDERSTMDEFVESVSADGIYEVTVQLGD